MKTNNWVYFKFQELTPEIRLNNKLKPDTVNRLDCVSANIPNNDYRGLTFFVNRKEQLFFYKTKADAISKADLKRQAVWMLTNRSINLSSMYIDIPEHPNFAYGNPPHRQMLGKAKNKPNPLFAFKNDLYLFIINSDYTVIELLVIPEQKNLWNHYYFKLIQGGFNDAIQKLRKDASTFFDYGL